MWKKVNDLLLYLVACAIIGTGLLLAYRLPHGGPDVGYASFLGYHRHEWGDIHTWLAYGAILLGVIHLMLNWQWLVKVAASRHAWRLTVGIIGGLLIIAGFVVIPLDRSGRAAREIGRHEATHR